jgi:hypothetical protein
MTRNSQTDGHDDDSLVLNAAAASMTTKTVTIRTLRVGAKQLTQSVFRQLPRRELIKESLPEPTFAGTPWGWVNNSADGVLGGSTQFIAQFGDELCRCTVRVEDADWEQGVLKTVADQYQGLMRTLTLVQILDRDPAIVEQVKKQAGRDMYVLSCRLPNDLAEHNPPAVHLDADALDRYLFPDEHVDLRKSTRGAKGNAIIKPPAEIEVERRTMIAKIEADAREKILKHFNCEQPTLTEAMILERVVQLTASGRRYRVAWNMLMTQLRSAPQLFIFG